MYVCKCIYVPNGNAVVRPAYRLASKDDQRPVVRPLQVYHGVLLIYGPLKYQSFPPYMTEPQSPLPPPTFCLPGRFGLSIKSQDSPFGHVLLDPSHNP